MSRDPDLDPMTTALSDRVMDALNKTVIWEDRHIGDLEWHLCDLIAIELMPFVFTQRAKAVEEFVNQVATQHAYNGTDDDQGQRFYDCGLNAWLMEILAADPPESYEEYLAAEPGAGR